MTREEFYAKYGQATELPFNTAKDACEFFQGVWPEHFECKTKSGVHIICRNGHICAYSSDTPRVFLCTQQQFEDGFKQGSQATVCVNPYHEIQTSLHTAWSYGYMKGREAGLAQSKSSVSDNSNVVKCNNRVFSGMKVMGL